MIVSAPPRALKSIASTSLRSMVTLATSRENSARPPLAEIVMFSAMLAPLKSIVSKPAWPSTVSLSSPGFQTKVSSPAPIRAVSLPSPPLIRSSPSLPMRRSLPRPPFIVSWMPSASRLAALITSSPPWPLRVSRSLACSWKKMLTSAWRPKTCDAAGVAGDAEHVGALGAVDRDRVGRAVAAAVRAAQVELDLRHVGAGQVADDDVVGAAERAELDVLDVVEVHRDVGDVAGEQRAPAVGDDVDVLGDVRAEEQHRVGAVLAFDRVVAVARVPLEHVVAGAHQGDVVAVVAEDEVVAVAAEEHVGALAAEDRVVAGAAVERQLDDAGRQRGRGDAVVAAAALDDERVVGAFGVGDVHLSRQAEHRDRGACAEDVDDVVAVGAVDDHGVGRRVARRAADRAREVDVHLASRRCR